VPIPDDDLQALVRQLASRPGHETVRVNLSRLLIDRLGAETTLLGHEQRIEASSRVDTLLGDTVFELKSDLRRERGDGVAGRIDQLVARLLFGAD
jgi:hypothetical protein